MLKNKISIIVCLVAVLITQSGFALASQTDGTILTGANAGFAWSDNIGWVNFGASSGNVHLTDSGLTGYAWSDKSGWISLQPTNGGVTNSDGTLLGYAWGTGLG